MRLLPLLSALLLPLLPAPALAQSIIPAADGTGTLVLPDGTTYTITGGTLSGDGANLFHSFEQFGLTANEVATFLANPSVQNILGRVVGGNASLIDGLMQVNGGANLYLINPAGILFGPNTVLNLDGSFTATSASGVGFGNSWLHALEPSDYPNLTGDPTAFSFTENAGAIINSGNLAVGQGERLTLMGGSVVNLGTLEAPGGQIAVLAVPGENLVILRPVGSLLGIELASLPDGAPSLDGLSPLDIPGLLRAGQPEIATGLVTNPDGTVSLVGSTTPLPTASGTTLTSGTLSVAGHQGGTVQVLGDRVALIGATVDASGTQGGGQVLIGGEYQGQGTTPTANRTFVDATSTITANAGETGDGGEVILWAEEGTQFDGTITAQGGSVEGDGGFVEVSGRQFLGFDGAVDVSAPNGELGTLLLDPTNIFIVNGASIPDPPGLPQILAGTPPATITISSAALGAVAADILLEATNNITLNSGVALTFIPSAGSITFTADADNNGTGDFIMESDASITARGNALNNGRDITISGANITARAPATSGSIDTSVPSGSNTSSGSITLSARRNVDVGKLDSRAFGTGNGGAISVLNNDAGTTTIDSVLSFSTAGTAGAVNLNANGGLLAVNGITNAGTTSGTAGAVTLRNNSGGMTFVDIRGQSVRATSSAASPFTFGNVLATDFISLTNRGSTLTTGTLSATTGSITVTSGLSGPVPGAVNLGRATAGTSITLETGDSGTIATGPLSAGTQINAITGMGGTLTAGSMSSGPGESGPSFTLQADEINLVGGAGTVQAPGRLLIQTASDGQPILLGGARDSSPSVLDLTAGDIEALANGFRDIVIGGALTTGTATISLAGNVDFADPVTLRTNGPITLTSGSLNGTDNASLTLDAGAGITAGELGTDGNDITLVGDRDGDGTGSVNLAGPVTTNGGAITISGAASIGAGVALLTTGSLNSGGGDITVNGTTTGSTSDAIGTHVGGAISSQGGNITLTGRGPNGGIFVTTASTLDAGTGNLVLNADDPRIVGQVRGLGALQIAPLTTTLPILLGGTGDIGTTFLNAAEIARLGDGFSQRTIGQPGHAGTMTLDNFTLSSPLAVNGTTILGPNQDTTWAAQADGSVLAGGFGSSLRLLNPTTITGGSATNTVQGTTSSDTITPTAANTLQLGTVQFRNISIFDGLGGFDTVRGSAANDTVNEVGTNAISIPLSGIRFNNIEAFDGLAGINTVIGSGRTNTVTSLGTNAISLNGMQFSNINSFDGTAGSYTVLGASGNDTVSVLSSVALQSNNIEFRGIRAFDGQGGTNTLLGTERDDFVTTTGPNALTLNGFRFLNISTFDGGIGTDTVVGTAGNDTVNDVGPNAIRLSGIRFNNIEAFDGLAGINTVIGSGRTNTVTSLAPNSLALNGVNFSNINSFDGLAGPYTLLGTAGNDTVSVLRSVALQANNVEFRGITAFDGQGGTNTLLGTAGNDTFTLGGGNVLQFGGFTFRNLQGLDGGSGVNTLVGTAGDDTFFLQSANGGFVQWLPFPALSFTNINAINTLTGQDSIALTGVPLDVPITHGGGTLILSNSTGGDIVLNANVQTPGNLVIGSSAGAITQTGGQVVARGTTSLEADGGITLAGANDFNGVTVPRSQSLTLVDINDLVLGDLFFTQGLDIRAVGNLTATRNLIQGAASSSPPLSLSSSRLTPGLPVGVTLTSGATLTTRDITVSGGPITLQANGPLTSGNLNTSGSVGGAVSLQSGDRIQVNTINAQGSSVGGRITATAATTFQVLGSFLDRNGIAASLSTVGGTQGGPMTLTYNTSLFTIGDASLNGTQAAITSGNVALKPGDFVFGSRVFGSGLPGQVSFIAPGSPPPPPPPSPPSDAVPEVILDDREERLAVDDRTGDGDEIPVRLTSTGGAVEDNEFQDIEADIASEFSGYFSGTFQPPRPVSLTDAQNTLRDIQALTGEVPALVYVRFNRQARGDGLELLLVSPHGDPLRVQVLSANPQAVIRAQELLRRQLTNPNLTNNRDYLVPAQQLYDWIIAPIRSELEAAGITNLSFIMDGGLRTLPLAALHDGERFLIESYSVGLVPSLGLIDPTYVDLNRQTSTMTIGGASQFLNQSPLLAARTEIEAIRSFWPSNTLAEANFTVAALQQTRQQAQIVHLATHAEFLRGAPDQSYIQFSDGRLSLDNMAQLRWFDPTVDLVTLSACQTAMGNAQAELGFAGFALQAGARSALASLWRVSDEATAGLMTTFYQQLDQQATKSEALRQAQLAFIRGEATIENGQIRWPGGTLPLPPALVFSGTQDLSHPFYWAAFTIVGSPW